MNPFLTVYIHLNHNWLCLRRDEQERKRSWSAILWKMSIWSVSFRFDKIQPAKVVSRSDFITRHCWNSPAFGGLACVNAKLSIYMWSLYTSLKVRIGPVALYSPFLSCTLLKDKCMFFFSMIFRSYFCKWFESEWIHWDQYNSELAAAWCSAIRLLLPAHLHTPQWHIWPEDCE